MKMLGLFPTQTESFRMAGNYIMPSVVPRIEYRYADKDKLIAPRLDSGKRFGTYGMIQLSVIWFYPQLPGLLYHPIDNAAAAIWWLDYYKVNPNVREAFFVPSPDQYETGTFTIPNFPPPEEPEQPKPWYNETLTASPYNYGGKKNT